MAQPVDIELKRTSHLRIVWDDGVETTIDLRTLRQNCPCATCREQRRQQADSAQQGPLRVLPATARPEDQTRAVDAELAGHYALRIRWADGHDTGFYDFSLLRRLGESPDRTGDGPQRTANSSPQTG